MSDKTGIEWTRGDDGTAGATWNPVTGCEKISAGCDRCYAATFAERWRGTPGHYFERGFDVVLRPDKLDLPLRWKRPRRIFVNSMSDLFHKDVPDGFIASVFGVMAMTPQHTYQVLTKRHARMRTLLFSDAFRSKVDAAADAAVDAGGLWLPSLDPVLWPLPNVWLGVSAENQRWLDIRLPALVETPAAVRFLSCEPLLGPVKIPFEIAAGRIHWVIGGGESGPGARPMDVDWVRSLVWQCADWDVPVFVKQLGSVLGRDFGAGPKGADWDAWPEDLKVREFPRVREMECAG